MNGVRLLEIALNIARTGIILNTEKYDECVSFYKNLFGLKVLFEEDGLTCFNYYGSYLMVETEGFAKPGGKTLKESPAKLRFNVTDIEIALQEVRAYGIEAHITKNDWGSTINIYDPDGNRIGIRDEATFKEQIRT